MNEQKGQTTKNEKTIETTEAVEDGGEMMEEVGGMEFAYQADQESRGVMEHKLDAGGKEVGDGHESSRNLLVAKLDLASTILVVWTGVEGVEEMVTVASHSET